MAKPGTGQLDSLGERDFLGSGKERNLAHLRQVHAHGIVRPGLVVILDRGQELVGLGFKVDIEIGAQIGFVQVLFDIEVVDRLAGQIDYVVRIGCRVVVQFVQ